MGGWLWSYARIFFIGGWKKNWQEFCFMAGRTVHWSLNRPEFYLDRSQSFEENSVYVCSADHLPQTPELGENVCLVCLGEHWNLNAYYERCSVILIHGSQDIFRIFNLVQEVFNQYDTWEERLWFILRMVQLCLKCWMPAEASLKIQCCL